MNQEYLKDLIEKYKKGACSSSELDQLILFIRDKSNDDLIELMFDSEIESEFDGADLIHLVDNTQYQPTVVPRNNFLRNFLLVAASLIAVLFFSFYIYKNTNNADYNQLLSTKIHLKLSSGEVIVLDSVIYKPKTIFENDQVEVIQNSGLSISLISKKVKSFNDDSMVLSVGKGKRLNVNFSDGSNIWVNSDSRLKFPVIFAANERVVDLVGEGYFDIMNAKSIPFKVYTSDQLLQVYGTKFNVRNYNNEDKHTVVLYEGKLSVKELKGKKGEVMLSPGEEVSLYRTADFIEKKFSLVRQDSSIWISGNNKYQETLLRDIFLDISHQYDIDVEWSQIPDLHFTGTLSQAMSLDEIINVLNKSANIKIINNNNKITF